MGGRDGRGQAGERASRPRLLCGDSVLMVELLPCLPVTPRLPPLSEQGLRGWQAKPLPPTPWSHFPCGPSAGASSMYVLTQDLILPAENMSLGDSVCLLHLAISTSGLSLVYRRCSINTDRMRDASLIPES